MNRPSLAALAAALVCSGFDAPAASADPVRGNVEPIVIVAGGQADCDVGYSDGFGAGFEEIATDPAGSWRVPALQPSPQSTVNKGQVYVWLSHEAGVPADQSYRLCEAATSVPHLAANLYRRLLARTTDPADTGFYGRKVDLVGTSIGATIARYCIAKVTGCAALVDDFVGIVAPSYGTTLASAQSCPWASPFGAYAFCQGLVPNSALMRELNGSSVSSPTYDGQWLNNGIDDTPGTVEYTNFYTTTDGMIQPYQRARLIDGAYNVRVYKPSTSLDHASIVSNTICPGSSAKPDRWAASATIEWAVYFAMDAARPPASVTPTASGPDGTLNCYHGPDRDDDATRAPYPSYPVATLPGPEVPQPPLP